MKIKHIFEPEPVRMGYRGDRMLWKKLSDLDISGDILESIKREIQKYFNFNDKDMFIKELSSDSGMSDGFVSPQWWKEIGLPILENRINGGLDDIFKEHFVF